MAPVALTRPGTGRLTGVDVEDDSEFARMVDRNADDIRHTILRSFRRRSITKVIALLVVIAVMVVVTAIIIGWAMTAVIYAIVVPVAVVYGWWSWKQRPSV
jgi:uncharacterized membrane protein